MNCAAAVKVTEATIKLLPLILSAPVVQLPDIEVLEQGLPLAITLMASPALKPIPLRVVAVAAAMLINEGENDVACFAVMVAEPVIKAKA